MIEERTVGLGATLNVSLRSDKKDRKRTKKEQGTITESMKSLTKPRFGKDDIRYWKNRVQKRSFQKGDRYGEVIGWQVRFQNYGKDVWFNLETQNKDVAASKARDIHLHIKLNGFQSAIDTFKEKRPGLIQPVTLGEYIQAVRDYGVFKPITFGSYTTKVRNIVASFMGLPSTKQKTKYSKGGSEKWRAEVEAFKLEDITTARINTWKKQYLDRVGTDPVKRKRAERTVNSVLRNGKSFFGPRVASQLSGIILPDPLPFQEVQPVRQSSVYRYRSTVDVQSLVAKATEELLEDYPDQYAVFLLALFAGLRRGEIDSLMWSAFDWDKNLIRIRHTSVHGLKTDSSEGDVPVEPEVMKLFKKLKGRSDSEFVISSERELDPKLEYIHYRATMVYKRLVRWLRENGVDTDKPLHTLRKEFGRLITEKHGIFAASKLLRHSSIQITASFYADDTRHLTVGMGGLLEGGHLNVIH